MDKEQAARSLFLEGWAQNRIAQVIDVTEKTIRTWKKKYAWEKAKIKYTLIEQASTDRLWKLIDYHSKVIEQQIDTNLQEGNLKPVDRGDIDALQKLFSVVKKKDTKWLDIVETIRQFVEYAQETDLEAAQSILPIADKFINEKRKLV